MTVSCNDCVHWKLTPALDPFAEEDMLFPEILRQRDEWYREQIRIADLEMGRFKSGEPFAYRPQFYPWCAKYTAEAQAGIDPVTGRRRRIFELCARRNVDGLCSGFERSANAASGVVHPLAAGDRSAAPGDMETAGASRNADESAMPRKDIAEPASRKGGDLTIEVQGEIHLGRRMTRLSTRERLEDDSTPFVSMPVGALLAEAELAVRTANDEVSMERVVDRFEPTEQPFSLRDQGLCQAYGIFGMPGCGKTYLLKRMLEQIVEHEKDDGERKYGGIILDPKAALIDHVTQLMKDAGRDDDLIVINTRQLLNSGKTVNIIDSHLGPLDLGRALVLAARSGGIGASEPAWFQEWAELFGQTLTLLRECYPGTVPTMRTLLDTILKEDELNGAPVLRLKTLIATATRVARESASDDQRNDMLLAIGSLERYLRDERAREIINNFISDAYGVFQMSRYSCYCREIDDQEHRVNLYDQAIEDGKILLVSVSPEELVLSRVLCTLAKCLFQQAVISRLGRFSDGKLRNFVRPLLFVADEYSQVASEVQGQPMGDASFFSLARQFGCLCLVASQSVHMLKTSSLGDAWQAIFANFAGTMFMRLNDPETAELATKLAGVYDWYTRSRGTSSGKEGLTESTTASRNEKKLVPEYVFTQVLKRAQMAFVGSRDAHRTSPGTFFIQVGT